MKNIIALLLLFIAVSNAEAGPNQGAAIPSEQGEIIFRFNEHSSNQIYIIGLSHRDTLTRANGRDTLKSQVEAYRIGEWLIQNREVELLLPEGFFSRKAADETGNVKRASLDKKTLEEKLGQENVYINAEMLLMESHNIKSQQIEDMNLYNSAREKVSQLEKYCKDSLESLFIKSSLDYLQERRTAAMLQKIPEVIESEYQTGRIKNKKAIFTVGMSHLPGIIKYLKQQKIEISSPAFSPYDDYSSGVKLLEHNFGVTVIIPRTLANNRELLKLTRLDDIQE